jgi:hypothetical protein
LPYTQRFTATPSGKSNQKSIASVLAMACNRPAILQFESPIRTSIKRAPLTNSPGL